MRNRHTLGLPLPLGETLKPGIERVREDRMWAQIRARRSTGMGGHSEPPRAGQYLPAPLSGVLKSDDSANERSRLWRGIRARQHQAQKSRAVKYPAIGFGLAATMAALLVFSGVTPWTRPASAPVAQTVPLSLTNGAAMRTAEASLNPQVVKLADGSEIRLDKGARVEPLLSSGTRFELLLRQGSAEFSVTPGGPRRWVIEAGIATVEVVGTVFRVTRTDAGVQVRVSRGTVLVRGEGVPDRVQRVTAGQSISVTKSAPVAAELAESKIEVGEITLTNPPTSVTPAAGIAPVRPAPTHAAKGEAPWHKQLAAGEYATAYAALGDKGLAREVQQTTSAEQLLELADVARLSGHPDQAVKPLERVIELHGRAPHAALAAFTLGRVYLDQLHQPANAAKAFEGAIERNPPHALLADCHARLVEAYARAGDLVSAERAASRYRALFPAGRHLSDLSVWTQP